MRIDAYTPYGPGGASTKVRVYDWLDHFGLRADRHNYLGLNANAASTLSRHPVAVARAERELRRRAKRACDELAIVSREVSPLSTGTLEEAILSRARKGVFDFDDAIWLPLPGPRRFFNQWQKTKRAVSAADAVIAGNEVLADWASAHSHNVVVVPSCVKPEDYSPKSTWALSERPKLVWLGSPSTEKYVADVAPILDQVCQATGAVLMVISGAVTRPRALDQWEWIHRVEWSHESARAGLAMSDIAIAPLRDDAFARGKCAYKLLQYAAAAVPMIGSPVGANEVALQRFDGLAPVSKDEWVDSLTALINESESMRRRRGLQGLQAVRTHYSFDAWGDAWSRSVGLDAETL